MGITADTLTWFLSWIKDRDFRQLTMCELGNQNLFVPTRPFPGFPEQFLCPSMTPTVSAKKYFEHMGFTHVSIDASGQDGALPIDLSKPVDLKRTFDIVTDFGTSEHLLSLYHCLRNVHALAKVGGLIFHSNPLVGNWPNHGYWYRDLWFYADYSKLLGYELLESKVAATLGNFETGWNVLAVMKKVKESEYPKEEDFNKLPVFSS